MTAIAQECRASANVPVPDEPADERNLYCVLPEGHDGEHYDDGAEVWWQHRSEAPGPVIGYRIDGAIYDPADVTIIREATS